MELLSCSFMDLPQISMRVSISVALTYCVQIIDFQWQNVKYCTLHKIDPIQLVFDVCDIEKDDKGLTLAEVQEKNCMDYLTSGFGITNDNIIKEFEAVDQNGDGVASKQETSLAFENLRCNLLRIIDPNEPSDGACFDKDLT